MLRYQWRLGQRATGLLFFSPTAVFAGLKGPTLGDCLLPSRVSLHPVTEIIGRVPKKGRVSRFRRFSRGAWISPVSPHAATHRGRVRRGGQSMSRSSGRRTRTIMGGTGRGTKSPPTSAASAWGPQPTMSTWPPNGTPSSTPRRGGVREGQVRRRGSGSGRAVADRAGDGHKKGESPGETPDPARSAASSGHTPGMVCEQHFPTISRTQPVSVGSDVRRHNTPNNAAPSGSTVQSGTFSRVASFKR